MTQLSPGKWRGLKLASTDQHTFTVLAFDQRGNFQKMLPDGTPPEVAMHIKRDVVTVLSRRASAVLLDPIFGLEAALAMSGRSGLLMALEKTGYSGDSTYRHVDFIPAWTVEKIKRMGASGVKLLVYYHPGSGELAAEIEGTIQTVADACHAADIPLFVEPLSYSLDANIKKDSAEFARQRPEIVRETARRLSRCGADVLKLEFPVDVNADSDPQNWMRACEAVSADCAVPWALLSAGVDFSTFQWQVRVACEAGASGFIGGRAIWQECVTMPPDEREAFLNQTALPRLDTLNDIAEKYARPWTDFFHPVPAAENWFEDYL